jgi:hypothetical protein
MHHYPHEYLLQDKHNRCQLIHTSGTTSFALSHLIHKKHMIRIIYNNKLTHPSLRSKELKLTHPSLRPRELKELKETPLR